MSDANSAMHLDALGLSVCIAGPTAGPAFDHLARAAGRHAETVTLMRPVIGGQYLLQSSHLQPGEVEQFFVDAVLKSGGIADVGLALERVAGRRPIPPERLVDWRDAPGKPHL